MNTDQIAIKSLQSIARAQVIDMQDACRGNPLLLDFRAVEIIGVSSLPEWSDIPITVAVSMKNYDIEGQIIESKALSCNTRHLFSGLVEIIDPQVANGGVEYGTFRIIEVKSAFPDLPIGKLTLAHVDKDRNFASFGILWVHTKVIVEEVQSRRLAKLRELGGNAKYADGKWTFTGIGKLVQSELKNGFQRNDEKTIRADLKQAAQSERDLKRAGFADGLGQR